MRMTAFLVRWGPRRLHLNVLVLLMLYKESGLKRMVRTKGIIGTDFERPGADLLWVNVAMLAKHPQKVPPTVPSFPVLTPLKISEQPLVIAHRSFLNSTAPGPSGLRATHIKQALFCPSSDQTNVILCQLCSLIKFLCTGNVPFDVVPHLCEASLLTSKKRRGTATYCCWWSLMQIYPKMCFTRSSEWSCRDTVSAVVECRAFGGLWSYWPWGDLFTGRSSG